LNRVLKITFLQKEKIQEDTTIFLHIGFKSIYLNASYNKTTKKNKKRTREISQIDSGTGYKITSRLHTNTQT
jgi:hypothetical protein